MQHVVQLAFEFDDERAKAIAENALESELDKIIKDIIIEKIAPSKYDYYTRKKEHDWSSFNYNVDEMVRQFLETYKDDILDRAATKIAESTKRTKAWKEKWGSIDA